MRKIRETPPWKRDDAMIGQTLSHYKVLEEIGRGGMGIVYRAVDLKLKRDVALKVLPSELVSDPERKLRFIREAQAAAKLRHQNLAVVYEVDEVAGTTFIAMELIEGGKLSERLRRGPLPATRAVEIAMDVANGLSNAHARGVVHRDLKPANILRTDDGRAKIIDFGLVKLVEPLDAQSKSSDFATSPRQETDLGVVMGTVSYMSPEQARGDPIDHRSDIFSFGVVLFEMLTGQLPFQAPSRPETLAAIINAPAPPLVSDEEGASRALAPLVRKCLAKNPDDRYQTVSEIITELQSVGAVPATRAEEPRRRHSGRRVWILAATVTIAIVLALFGRLADAPPGATETPRPSLAVLPFENTRSDPGVDYLSDGVAESLINRLSRVPELRVIARSSAFRYRGPGVDPGAVGEELGVGAVLTGRVVRIDETLNVQVELVEVGSGTQLWGQQYSREMTDVFQVQDDMAFEITQALRIELNSDQQAQLLRHGTGSTEAYDAYLRGQFYFNQRTDDGFRKAIQYFERAIELDPGYALAHVGLADSYHLLSRQFYGTAEPSDRREYFRRARAASERGAELDETLGEARISLAFVLLHDGDWKRADREFQEGIALNPRNVQAYHWYSYMLSSQERHEQAVAYAKRGLEIDPGSPLQNRVVGTRLLYAKRYPEAIEHFRRALALDASIPLGRAYLVDSYWLHGKREDAVVEAERIDTHLGAFYRLVHEGKRAEASEERALVRDFGYPLSCGREAHYQVLLGEDETALDTVERFATLEGQPILFCLLHPILDPLREKPRFQDLLRRFRPSGTE